MRALLLTLVTLLAACHPAETPNPGGGGGPLHTSPRPLTALPSPLPGESGPNVTVRLPRRLTY